MTPGTATCQASLSFTISQSLLTLMCIEPVMPSNHLVFWHLLFFLLSIFSNELTLCIRCPKFCSFSFSISPSNEYTGLTSFKIDWFDLLAIQGTFKSLLQHHISKASVLWCNILYGLTLIAIHDYWKNHSFDYMNVCLQNDVSAF